MSESIDFESREQVLRLALAAMYSVVLMARGAAERNTPAQISQLSVESADALINAVVTPPP
jgi:hypothetical protein